MSRMWPFSKKEAETIAAVDTAVEPVQLPGPTPMDDVWEEIHATRDVTNKLLNDTYAADAAIITLTAKVLALESKEAAYDASADIVNLNENDNRAREHFKAVDLNIFNLQEAVNSVSTALEELRQSVAHACEHADTAKRQSDEALVKASQKSGGSGGIGSIA